MLRRRYLSPSPYSAGRSKAPPASRLPELPGPGAYQGSVAVRSLRGVIRMLSCWRVRVLAACVLVVDPYAAWSLLPAPASPSAGPLLWVGRLVDGRGDPVTGTVLAQIRPAPSAIPSRQQVQAAEEYGLVGPSAPSIPLASAATAPDGRFALRAVMPSNVPEAYTPGGWVHILLFAETDDGSFGITTDSVRWLPAGAALPAGAWVSSLTRALGAERLRLSATNSARAALGSLLAADRADGNERPETIMLSQPADARSSRVATAGGGAPEIRTGPARPATSRTVKTACGPSPTST